MQYGNKIQYHADCQYRTMYLSWIIMQYLLQYDTVPLYIYDHAVQLTFVFHYAIIMLVRYNLVRELGGLIFCVCKKVQRHGKQPLKYAFYLELLVGILFHRRPAKKI